MKETAAKGTMKNALLLLGFFAMGLALLGACSKRAEPLPGDSVQGGRVALSPPRTDTTPNSEPALKAVPVLTSAALTASANTATKPREPQGAIEALLFAPELVMEHQEKLGIDGAQRDVILKEVARTQSEMVKLQWDLQGAKEALVKVLDHAKVDERASAAAAARVMEHESKVKAAHLAMLIRVKNALTPAQQDSLKKLREGR
jgi:Spy/CpxP family protein refolding chaperone